jgi:hypothetical protein
VQMQHGDDRGWSGQAELDVKLGANEQREDSYVEGMGTGVRASF